MLDYFKFLLEKENLYSGNLENIRKILNKPDSYKILINALLDTELKSYIQNLVDYPLSEYTSINSEFSITYADKELVRYRSEIKDTVLREISISHYNPIWRVTGFFCHFLIESNKVFKKISNE